MNKTKIIFYLYLVTLLFFNFAQAGTPDRAASGVKEREIEKARDESLLSNTKDTKVLVQDKSLTPANFILVTDVIDAFGGQKYNGGCDLSIFAGGQPSAIGSGNSTNFKLYAGFVYPTVVKCGDANGDGKVSVSDVVYLINYLFKGGPVPKPFEAGEANCDSKLSVSDVVYLINYLFKGGPPPIC